MTNPIDPELEESRRRAEQFVLKEMENRHNRIRVQVQPLIFKALVLLILALGLLAIVTICCVLMFFHIL